MGYTTAAPEGVVAAFTAVRHGADRVTVHSVDDVEKSSKEGVVAALGKVEHAAAGIADQKICDSYGCTIGDAGESVVGAVLTAHQICWSKWNTLSHCTLLTTSDRNRL